MPKSSKYINRKIRQNLTTMEHKLNLSIMFTLQGVGSCVLSIIRIVKYTDHMRLRLRKTWSQLAIE